MLTTSIKELKEKLQANLCYQLLITPLPLSLNKKYRDFAAQGREYLKEHRTEVIKHKKPRPYIIHHFAQPNNPNAKKILVAHGWMSRSAYMSAIIRRLHHKGFDVYAIDFPAHGESKGFQLPWVDATQILAETLNEFGPFYGAVGHSYGGAMLLNTMNLSTQFPQWHINESPERVILICSPTSMHISVQEIAKKFKLNRSSYTHLRNTFNKVSDFDVTQLNYHYYSEFSSIKFLCIHGKEDTSIPPRESINFCEQYPHASLCLLSDVDHIGVLLDERVERNVSEFFMPLKEGI